MPFQLNWLPNRIKFIACEHLPQLLSDPFFYFYVGDTLQIFRNRNFQFSSIHSCLHLHA